MRNFRQQELNYDKYHLSANELAKYGFEGMGIVILFGYFFYRSIIITVIGMPYVIIFIIKQKKKLKEIRKKNLQMQFKDTLISVNSSLKAGYSLENSFLEAEKDMNLFYGSNSEIIYELNKIRTGLKNGISLNQLLLDLGNRTNIEEIKDFAEILVIGKQVGGNLSDMIKNYITIAEEKQEVMEEVNTMIYSKRFEQKIMNLIPFFIIFYVELTSKGFFDSLYNNIIGRLIMTVCLGLYIVSIKMSEKIIDIHI